MNRLPSNIRENLRFLIAEVSTQLEDLRRFLKTGAGGRAQRILDRRGYSENLMLRIQDACIQAIAEAGARSLPRLSAIQAITADLDRMTGLARDIVNQAGHAGNRRVVPGKRHLSMLGNVVSGIASIEAALEENDTRLALGARRVRAQDRH